MKIYDVSLSVVYNGHMTVKADTSEEAQLKAEESLNYETLKDFPDQVTLPNGGLLSFGDAEVMAVDEIPEWTSAKEDKLFEAVYKGGGFVRLENPLFVTVTEDDVKRRIKLMCLVIVDDNGHYLKGITDNYEMWDLLDYLNDQDLCRVYEAVCCQ